MKSKWFEDVFLQSIFERIGHDTRWLTAKQTAVCTQYMQRHTAHIETANGYQNHDGYTYKRNGREVWLSYSKKNGCGTIWFGYNAEEQEQARTENERERLQKIIDTATRRLKLHPDKYAAHVEKLKIEIDKYQRWIEEDIADGDTDGIENLRANMYKLKEELIIWEGVKR